MGISNLKKLISTSARTRKLSDYRGKRLGIDVSIWLYRFIYRDEANAVVDGMLRQLKQFYRNQIIPVYVFDGKASSEIKIEIERRQFRRQRVNDNIDTLSVELTETLENLGEIEAAAATTIILNDHIDYAGNVACVSFAPMDVPQFLPDSDDEIDTESTQTNDSEPDLRLKVIELQSRITSLQKQTRRPTKEAVESCKELLTLLGVPYVQSEGESDIKLSELMASGAIDAVMSEDTDMLPYGCHTFITGFKDNDDTVTEFRLENVLNDLKLTREQFVDVCILCGCDYAEKIYKIGVKKGYELIKKHGCIEKIITHIDATPGLKERHPYPEDYLIGVNIARSMFLTRTPGTDPSAAPGRTISELTLANNGVTPGAFDWRFDPNVSAAKQKMIEFLTRNSIRDRDWQSCCKMCEDWRNQRSIHDFFQNKK